MVTLCSRNHCITSYVNELGAIYRHIYDRPNHHERPFRPPTTFG